MKQKKILITAGGTGGHIFPAFALACKLSSDYDILFVIDKRGYKKFSTHLTKYNKKKIKIYTIPAHPFTGSAFAKCYTLFVLLLSSIWMFLILLFSGRFALVVGFGGYATLPTMLAAALMMHRVCIHEQNTVMGIANKLISYFADKILCAMPLMHPMDIGYTLVGVPLRPEFYSQSFQPYSIGKKINVLILGGSQGAKSFDTIIPNIFATLSIAQRESFSLIQQSSTNHKNLVKRYADIGITDLKVEKFFNDIPTLMNNAHIIIARAGALTIAEIQHMKRPSILIPLPTSAGNHQLYNAKCISASGNSVYIKEKDMTPTSPDLEHLQRRVTNIIANPQKLIQMHKTFSTNNMNSLNLTSKMIKSLI